MNINLHILKEDLKKWDFHGTLLDPPVERHCAYALILRKLPDVFQNHILYILSAELLNHAAIPEILPSASPHPSILCIGCPPGEWLHNICNLLYTEEEITVEELGNLVNFRFFMYQEWADQLQEAVDLHLSFTELAIRSASVVQNAIYAQGASFRVLCTWLPDAEQKTALYEKYRNNELKPEGYYLSPEEINTLITDQEYNLAIQAAEPCIYSGILYGYRTLFYNIFIENVFVARLCFDEIIKPFTDKDFALIEILGEYFRKRLVHDRIYSFDRSTELEEILQDLLEHTLIPEQKILSFLHTCQWNVFDTYVCLVLELKAKDTTGALEALALQMSQIVRSDCYTIRNRKIVFVCNLTIINTTRDQLYRGILPFLRDNLLSAGISTTYRDFKNLYYYYHQAAIAKEIGEQKDPTHWYFKFEEYQMDYMIAKCTENTLPEILIPEGLKALIDYDQKKKRSYTKTLRIYLEHDRNIADTIRAAYMHRNTFLYQIQKIQEILQMDLDDPDNRLILQMAFRIIDHQKQ